MVIDFPGFFQILEMIRSKLEFSGDQCIVGEIENCFRVDRISFVPYFKM
jgi:hypothetical protein